MTQKIYIAGSGGIGEAVAILIREWSDKETEIFLGDVSEANLSKTLNFLRHGSEKKSKINLVTMPFDGINDEMKAAFEQADILLDCSPGGQAPRMAGYAAHYKMHYANLTEYVAETDEIIRLAANADTGFVLQTGLAPGFINVLAMSLYRSFQTKFGVEKVEKIGMKVGALTAHAHQPHFYGFTWSPIGVATEYVKLSRVIREYQITEMPALSDREKIIIGGRTYEADLTSGGAADLPEFFAKRAASLDYKTLRHVGHYDWVQNIIKDLPNDENLPDKLLEIFLRDVPAVEDDFVLAHAFVEGFDEKGIRRMLEKAYFVEPLEINGHTLRAIQTTTAAPLIESAMMLLSGKYKGVILQSQINAEEFLQGSYIKKIYGT